MKNQPTHTVPIWALAATGFSGIVALFYFGYDQDLLIRVTLGLAAAGLASCLPGLLRVKSRTISAGGAVAVFVVVMFADDIGRTFSPATKVPGVSSNVRLSRDQMQYQSEIASAQFEIWNENYDHAIDILNHAHKHNPKEPLALHMIGTLYANNLRKFKAAAEVFEVGYKLGGIDKGRFAQNLALSYDAMGNTTQAKNWIDVAYKDSSREEFPSQWDDVVYDRGLINMIAWLRDNKQQRTPSFEVAAESFNAFLDHRPKTPHWAEFNLACLHATAGEQDAVQQLTWAKAMGHFDNFLREIQGMIDADKLRYHRAIARRVLALNGSEKGEKRGPLEPVECPAIRNAWKGTDRNWKKDVEDVFAEDVATTVAKNS
jgi:tetratricopeptide (TPR) repeat protein